MKNSKTKKQEQLVVVSCNLLIHLELSDALERHLNGPLNEDKLPNSVASTKGSQCARIITYRAVVIAVFVFLGTKKNERKNKKLAIATHDINYRAINTVLIHGTHTK